MTQHQDAKVVPRGWLASELEMLTPTDSRETYTLGYNDHHFVDRLPMEALNASEYPG